jgi:hypothetical protein
VRFHIFRSVATRDQLRTGWVGIRRKVRCTPSSKSTVIVCSVMWTVRHTVGVAWPRASFYPATTMHRC